MIVTLEKAKQLLGITDASKDDYLTNKLQSLEIMIRNLTNNKFLDTRIRVKGNFLFEDTKIMGVPFGLEGFRKNNTIEIVDSLLNDGLYSVVAVDSNSITVDKTLEAEQSLQTLITKVAYPYDIVDGVIKLIQYDLKMGSKIGIKQEAISRHSVTYYDVNATESVEGYPAALMKFLNKYKKLRW
ncbi:MAG: phage head-tail connector protein [Sedimentibacter sp.]|uniref:phage head-tail connector protein n=1 Tax=Sedimentibacter sp. TaxID=1960295 RepID=UPI0029823DF3|nr:phage head-tail connector protein [Sedimentibacter sp.]MDW5300752.1 phage head-tail connector protein [Sedimentibacter sp.]